MKSEGHYQLSVSQYKTMGPFAPKSRSALLCITRGGVLRLLFQQPDSRWSEVKKSMDALASSEDILSHASFCADRGIRSSTSSRKAGAGLQSLSRQYLSSYRSDHSSQIPSLPYHYPVEYLGTPGISTTYPSDNDASDFCPMFEDCPGWHGRDGALFASDA